MPPDDAQQTGPAEQPAAGPLIVPPRRCKVFMLKDFVPRVFEGKDGFLERHNIEMVDEASAADILIGRRVRDFKPNYIALDRLNVVWTHEPFFAMNSVPVVRVDGCDVHVFNLYNRNVYTDDFFDLRGKPVAHVAPGALNVPFDNRRIVAVMTRKEGVAIVGGTDRSLMETRERIAVDGHAAGGVDIFGGGWDEGIALGESRYVGDRRVVKAQILGGYNFNLCLENCLWDHYVTEKLWEAIAARCLPIYFASDTILQFPALDAGILVNRHADYAAIRRVIDGMTEGEFVDRLNTLIDFYNRSIQRKLRVVSRQRSQAVFSAFLRSYA